MCNNYTLHASERSAPTPTPPVLPYVPTPIAPNAVCKCQTLTGCFLLQTTEPIEKHKAPQGE